MNQRRGRPKGSKNREYAVAPAVFPPGCVKCGSTERVPGETDRYLVRDEAGVKNGRPFNRIEWHRTQCAGCGQHYRYQVYLFEVEGEAA